MEKLGQVVWFDVPDAAIKTADFISRVDPDFQLVNGVEVGQAIRNSVSLREPIRIERIGGNYGLLWKKINDSGEVIKTTHILTYEGSNVGQSHTLKRFQEVVPSQTWPEHVRHAIEIFERRVRSVLGEITPERLSRNSIDVVLDLCNGIRLRKNGAVYFIPDFHKDILDPSRHY